MEVVDKKTLELDGDKVSEWDVDCLSTKIKEVSKMKTEKPQLYAAALDRLQKDATIITSIADLKKLRGKKSSVEKEVEENKYEQKKEMEEKEEKEYSKE
jgi:hypothetical protein